MTQVLDQQQPATTCETDLVSEVQRVLAISQEPMTLSKIRAHLPTQFRSIELDNLAEALRRQVAANVLIAYPKYRSQQDRFWDRPMPVHIANLIRAALEEKPMPWSELRRKLPAYAVAQAQTALLEQVAQGLIFQHPRINARGKECFGLQAADAKTYLRPELDQLFARLEQLSFGRAQLREAALELLHEEEWGSPRTMTSAAESCEAEMEPSCSISQPAIFPASPAQAVTVTIDEESTATAAATPASTVAGSSEPTLF